MKNCLENVLAIILACFTIIAFHACKGGNDEIDYSKVSTQPNGNNGGTNNSGSNAGNNTGNNTGIDDSGNNNDNNNSGTSTPTYNVTTGDFIAGITEATLRGSVSGVSQNVDVGIIYGRSSDLNEYNGIIEEENSSGSFEVRIAGLEEQETYYYRAYAYINNMLYYGEVKSFTTAALTYMIGGKTYKMVKVEGGPRGTFFMMQTEIIPNDDFIIGSTNYGPIDINKNGCLVKTEVRTFLAKVYKSTGILFRMPTKEEWMFAAKGGNKSNGYLYSGSDDINEVAWYSGNSLGFPHEPALKKPNELGLYDMSGNYSELTNNYQFDNLRTRDDGLPHVDDPFYGGNFMDVASDCTITSFVEGTAEGKIPGTNTNEALAVLCDKVTVRLVYQR